MKIITGPKRKGKGVRATKRIYEQKLGGGRRVISRHRIYRGPNGGFFYFTRWSGIGWYKKYLSTTHRYRKGARKKR